jgi:translocation and assembly module TamB
LKPLTARLQPGSLDARVDVSDVALSELPLPTVWHETIGGTVRGQLHASGDVASPQLTGTVSVRNGVLQHKDLDRIYRPITVDIKLTPGAIAIEQMKYREKNDAQLDCTGKIGLKGLTPTTVELYLTGQRVTLPYKRAITTRFDPELHLTGSYAAPHLEGKVTIREARISLDQIVDEGPSDIVVLKDGGDVNQTIQFADEPDTSDGLADRLSAELAVDARRNVWIKGQDIDAEISGNLKLKKERRKPARLTGRLKPVRGRYDFYGRRFTITDGWIDFIGKPDPDPYFDIWAETKIKDVTIILNLTRKVKKIEVELSSRPEMQQSDIISYLVFGRRTDELRGQQSAGAEMSAMAIGGKVAAAELERILGQTGVVDTFTLDMGSEDLTQGSASIGKYVTPDLFVIYRYQFSTDTPNEIEIDYQINKNFSIRSQYGNEKTTGIDLIWQHDFNRLSDD